MFEYWFHGLEDGEGPFTHNDHTSDFLEFVCRVADMYGQTVAGKFVTELLTTHENMLSYMRVDNDWKFELKLEDIGDGVERKIILHKLK